MGGWVCLYIIRGQLRNRRKISLIQFSFGISEIVIPVTIDNLSPFKVAVVRLQELQFAGQPRTMWHHQ